MLREVDVSLVSPFVQMNFILTYLLAVIFFKESITMRKIIGISMVALSILLLSGNINEALNMFWDTFTSFLS